MSFRFQFRRGTTAERNASNPILAAGEPAVVLDSGQPAELVLGDGVTPMAGLRAAVWDDDTRLALAEAATQPGDLGTAAVADVADFATAAQGAKADAAAPRSLTPTQPVDVDVNEAVAVVGETQVSLTTYAGSPNAVVHPSLLFFDEGWNGWRYWMAYTPYNGADAQLENPCIAVSNDGETWVTPAGLTNPVEASPPGAGYNADPCLCMSADGRTMLMVWKINDATRQIVLRTSTDGVTWTARVVLVDNPYEDVSPALLWDNGVYRMWTIVYKDGPPNTMYVRTATAPEGPWSAPVACTYSGLPTGSIIWHMDIKRAGQQYHTVLATAPDAAGPALTRTRLWFGKSTDGIVWEFGRKAIMDTGLFTQQGYYKAAMLPKITPQGLTYDVWYSGTGDFRMYRTRVTFDRSSARDDLNGRILAAKSGLSPWVLCDDFNRSDTTAGLGTATTGQAWTTASGNNMGISGGQAYLPAAANSRAIIEAGVSNLRVGATFPVIGTSGWIIFRYVDASNLWRVGHSSSGVIQLQKIVGGTLTALTGGGLFNALRAGDRLDLEAVDDKIRILLNGREIFLVTDSAVSAGTKVGINVDNTTVRLDDFTVRAL